MIESDFLPKDYSDLPSNGNVTWESPSNIALIKYWGKYGEQLPANSSLSFTLSNCKTKTVLKYQLKKEASKSFDFEIMDTLATYSLSLNVRHSIDYEYQNLFVFVSGEVNDTIELMLADKNGKWKGRGISDVREFTHNLKKDKTFSKKGKHYINIEQAMRYGASEKIQHLPNILDVGLIIKKQDD